VTWYGWRYPWHVSVAAVMQSKSDKMWQLTADTTMGMSRNIRKSIRMSIRLSIRLSITSVRSTFVSLLLPHSLGFALPYAGVLLGSSTCLPHSQWSI